jgi:WS/DGAT/MGAT family acyltransferase
VILRIHHCIADGIALASLALALSDTDPRAPWPAAAPRRSPRRSWYRPGPIGRTVSSALRVTTQVAGTLMHEGMETLAHPAHALDLAWLGIGGALAAGRVIQLEPAPPTPLKGKLGSTKRVAMSRPIPLTDIKAISRASDSKVNDVMLAALGGAFRRYIQGRGHPTGGLSFTAVVPVNLRPAGTGSQLGNRFGLTFVSLPVGVADPLERLQMIREHTAEIKESPEAIVAFGVLNVMGAVPPGISEFVADFFGGKATVVITNVAAPKERLYLAGAPISTAMGFVPHAVNVGVGVSIVSYAGQIRVGIVTDRGLVPDPQAIMAAFYAELDELSHWVDSPGFGTIGTTDLTDGGNSWQPPTTAKGS